MPKKKRTLMRIPGRKIVTVDGERRAMDDCGHGQRIRRDSDALGGDPVMGTMAGKHIAEDEFSLGKDDGRPLRFDE